MIETTECAIGGIAIHSVGNRAQEEGMNLSKEPFTIDDDVVESSLLCYFTSAFKSEEYYNLYHQSELRYNEIYGFVSAIFDDPDSLHSQSVNIAKHLYEQSNHPKIKGGELYVVYLQDCIADGEMVDAVGIFKSENKDIFLKVLPTEDNFDVEAQRGININKLDKGCLIFNSERENGYLLSIVDNTNKGAEAHYWIDDFLHVRQRQDEYYNTQNVISLAKSFVTKELPKEFDVSKADQVDMLNKSAKFFKDNDRFDMEEFASEVIGQPEVIDSFNRYKDSYAQELDIDFTDSFAISDTAAKRGARSLKSVIKLDKNFHIYIHGDRSKIETGEDDRGKYYKVYYSQEM